MRAPLLVVALLLAAVVSPATAYRKLTKEEKKHLKGLKKALGDGESMSIEEFLEPEREEHDEKLDAILDRALAQVQKGAFHITKQTISELREAAAEQKEHGAIQAMYAFVLSMAGQGKKDKKRAMAQLHRAIEVAPDQAELHFMLARRKEGRVLKPQLPISERKAVVDMYDEGLRVFESGAEQIIDPKLADAYYSIGRLAVAPASDVKEPYREADAFGRAHEAWRACIKANPKHAEAYEELAMLLSKSKGGAPDFQKEAAALGLARRTPTRHPGGSARRRASPCVCDSTRPTPTNRPRLRASDGWRGFIQAVGRSCARLADTQSVATYPLAVRPWRRRRPSC